MTPVLDLIETYIQRRARLQHEAMETGDDSSCVRLTYEIKALRELQREIKSQTEGDEA